MSPFEELQPITAFVRAGRLAFLIGVPRGNNPYRKEIADVREAWDRGYQKAQEHCHCPFAAEERLAAFLGYAPPRREVRQPVRRQPALQPQASTLKVQRRNGK